MKGDRQKLLESKEEEGKEKEKELFFPWLWNRLWRCYSGTQEKNPPHFDGWDVSFYYQDLAAACDFYSGTLGLREVDREESLWVRFQLGADTYLTLLDGKRASDHSFKESKSTAIALVTDELEAWWSYIVSQPGINILSAFKPKAGTPHSGFVIIDPEGYYIEFERFNKHPENDEKLLPAIESLETQWTSLSHLGFKAAIVWFYYKDLSDACNFYQDLMDTSVQCDQGWAKILRLSQSGFVGLVDEVEGMHKFCKDKAVMLSLKVNDVATWVSRVRHQAHVLRQSDTQLLIADCGNYSVQFFTT